MKRRPLWSQLGNSTDNETFTLIKKIVLNTHNIYIKWNTFPCAHVDWQNRQTNISGKTVTCFINGSLNIGSQRQTSHTKFYFCFCSLWELSNSTTCINHRIFCIRHFRTSANEKKKCNLFCFETYALKCVGIFFSPSLICILINNWHVICEGDCFSTVIDF